jgi:cyclohexanone monooxygenase
MSQDKSLPQDTDTMDFDPVALRRKYDLERDKRLRTDGNEQYVEVSGKFEHFVDDPYADASFSRDVVRRNVDVLIVGGGFGGLMAGAQLRAAGFEDISIVDKAGDFGGTWYWNRFPGAACDTESYIYLPLLEETGYMPVSKYAFGPEIFAHAQRIGRHYDLYGSALFLTTITEMRWLNDAGRWRVTTDRGDDLRARFVILAGGPLNRPKLPGIKGIETFKGHTFHTARWDYAYTGGSPAGNLTGLADKRVGIIGTGATSVQCVPHLGRSSKELFVFQRTPSAVDLRNDRPTDPEWVKSLNPGWQRERMDNFTAVISGDEFEVNLVDDGWTDIIGNILLAARRKEKAGEPVKNKSELRQLADFQKMERVRARVDGLIKDRPTAESLKPWYNQFCKRPCFHDQYLDTFNLPNVHLVDTEGAGVQQITERGVVVNGREYELDCLVFSTGFEWGTDFTRRIGFEIEGRNGLTLTEKWKDGMSSLHGMFTRGFPNMLVMTTTQSGQSANFVHMLDHQARHIAYILSEVRKRGVGVIEADTDAEAEWTETIVQQARKLQKYLSECTPGFYNNEGNIDERTLRNSRFWRGPMVFLRMMDAWRKEGALQGLELTPLVDKSRLEGIRHLRGDEAAIAQ